MMERRTPRRSSGRCGHCRRRHSRDPRRPADRAGGQQHAGVVRTAEGQHAQHRGSRRSHRHGCWVNRHAAEQRGDADQPSRVAAAFKAACLEELDAPKAGQRARLCIRPPNERIANFGRSASRSGIRSPNPAPVSANASTPPSMRRSRQSASTPISASFFCARRSRPLPNLRRPACRTASHAFLVISMSMMRGLTFSRNRARHAGRPRPRRAV